VRDGVLGRVRNNRELVHRGRLVRKHWKDLYMYLVCPLEDACIVLRAGAAFLRGGEVLRILPWPLTGIPAEVSGAAPTSPL
jgi:hypothetical protein